MRPSRGVIQKNSPAAMRLASDDDDPKLISRTFESHHEVDDPGAGYTVFVARLPQGWRVTSSLRGGSQLLKYDARMTIRQCCVMMSVLLLGSCAGEVQLPASDGPASDASAIYAEVLQQENLYHGGPPPAEGRLQAVLFSRARNGLLALQTREEVERDEFVDELARRILERGFDGTSGDFRRAGVPLVVVDALVAAHREQHALVPELALERLDVIRVDRDDYRARVDDVGYSRTFEELGVDVKGDRFVGVMSVSPIGFSDDRRYAAVGVDYGGVGFVLLLTRLAPGWRVTGRVQLWIS